MGWWSDVRNEIYSEVGIDTETQSTVDNVANAVGSVAGVVSDMVNSEAPAQSPLPVSGSQKPVLRLGAGLSLTTLLIIGVAAFLIFRKR